MTEQESRDRVALVYEDNAANLGTHGHDARMLPRLLHSKVSASKFGRCLESPSSGVRCERLQRASFFQLVSEEVMTVRASRRQVCRNITCSDFRPEYFQSKRN